MALFWYQEWRYQLPTPVPAHYKPVPAGQLVELPPSLQPANQKPAFLHFFNPDCPCSRFNIEHFKSLVREFHEQINFTIVVVNNERYTATDIRNRFGVDLPISFDTSLAAACGVYSTPQAVILDKTNQLYYRGNYNRSRYCSDKKTAYAHIALQHLLHQKNTASFDRYALTAYGCTLPECEKN